MTHEDALALLDASLALLHAIRDLSLRLSCGLFSTNLTIVFAAIYISKK